MEPYSKDYSSEKITIQQSTSRATIEHLLNEGANAWGISRNVLITMLFLPLAAVLGAVISALMGKEMYVWYTGEDQFAETLQVLFYAMAFVMNILVINQLWKKEYKTTMFLYSVVLLGLLFMIGEELSWGQRIFGWDTSESLRSINKQDETNIHNIYGVGSTFKWLQMLVGAYGALFPLLLLRIDFFKRDEEFWSFVIPHYTLIPFFLPLFIWRIYRNVFEAPKEIYFAVSEFNEVMELILAMGMALFMIYQWRRLKADSAKYS